MIEKNLGILQLGTFYRGDIFVPVEKMNHKIEIINCFCAVVIQPRPQHVFNFSGDEVGYNFGA